jgi:hypothetical protein
MPDEFMDGKIVRVDQPLMDGAMPFQTRSPS